MSDIHASGSTELFGTLLPLTEMLKGTLHIGIWRKEAEKELMFDMPGASLFDLEGWGSALLDNINFSVIEKDYAELVSNIYHPDK